MTSNGRITPITDPKTVEQIKQLLAEVADDCWDLNLLWLSRNHWVAVPSERAGNFEPLGGDLPKAMSAVECLECFAIATEPLGDHPACYEVEASKEGLTALWEEWFGIQFALIPKNRLFTVLFSIEYFIVAGPKAFVELAFGVDIATARAWFDEAVEIYLTSDWESTKRLGKGLREVANRYRSLGEP